MPLFTRISAQELEQLWNALSDSFPAPTPSARQSKRKAKGPAFTPAQPYILDSLIKDVIFNDKATIVFWHDGTKTSVAVRDNDAFSPVAGLALCITKYLLGNTGRFNEELKHQLKQARFRTNRKNSKENNE